VLVWFCITLMTFHAKITTIFLCLSRLCLKHYWFHFFLDTVYVYGYICCFLSVSQRTKKEMEKFGVKTMSLTGAIQGSKHRSESAREGAYVLLSVH